MYSSHLRDLSDLWCNLVVFVQKLWGVYRLSVARDAFLVALIPLLLVDGNLALLSAQAAGGASSGAAGNDTVALSIKRNFEGERKTIKWSEFRNKIRAALPQYTEEQLIEELAELNVEAQYIGGDIMLNGEAFYNLTIDPNSPERTFIQTLIMRPSISKKFLHTGTTLEIGLDKTLQIDCDSCRRALNTFTIAPRLTVTQDLMQNFFGLLDRLNFADAERELAIVKLQRAYNERQLQQRYDQLYLDWILLWRMNVLLSKQLSNSNASLNNAREQLNLNYIDDETFLQIYNSQLFYRRTLLENEQQILATEQRLARFLGDMSEQRFQPDLDILGTLLQKASEPLGELHFEDSAIWAISEQSLKRLRILYKFRKLQRLPSLTLSASIGLETSALYEKSQEPEYSKLRYNYLIGLNLSWPILMRGANNAIKTSRIRLQQLETSLNKQRQEFEIDIAQQRSAHEFLLENYEIQQGSAYAQNSIYAQNQIKYRQARAGIRDLLDAEIQRLSAQLNLLETENQLIKLSLDYQYQSRNGDLLSP